MSLAVGAVTTSAATYASVKAALSGSRSLISDTDYTPFLQGSYASVTNTYGDSDVDIIVRLNETFVYDLSELSPAEEQRAKNTIIPATYQWSEFYIDVLASLKGYYGVDRVHPAKHCIKVDAASGRLAADVVACVEYRRYTNAPLYGTPTYESGICFYTTDMAARQVVNYPIQHLDNGETKNANTDKMFKPSVRIFKNAKACLLEDGELDDGDVPSYFLQCLLYNVPDHRYGGTQQQNFLDILEWLENHTNELSTFVSQNEQIMLFGEAHEQWSTYKARKFIRALRDLWDNW